jgi:hypothetical protein
MRALANPISVAAATPLKKQICTQEPNNSMILKSVKPTFDHEIPVKTPQTTQETPHLTQF